MCRTEQQAYINDTNVTTGSPIINGTNGISDGHPYIHDTIVITNRHLVKGDYLTQIRKVVGLKPYAVILREKDLTSQEYEELSNKVLQICNAQNVVCYLHSEYQIAKNLGCRNLHVSINSLEEYLHEFDRISVSCHSLEDVKKAIDFGVSQIVLGTIFETDCKKGLKGKGLSFVSEICEYCKEHGDIPVFAIGGINPDNIESVKEAGAKGGCMMSYVMNKI